VPSRFREGLAVYVSRGGWAERVTEAEAIRAIHEAVRDGLGFDEALSPFDATLKGCWEDFVSSLSPVGQPPG
jgi:hypothetical protein